MLVVVSEEAPLVERVRRIASCCAQDGALVSHARDVADAKAVAARHGIRLCILDLALVAGDCESQISDLLGAANWSAVLVVTGGNDRESVLHALRSGAADFARYDRPPEDEDSLERVLRRILEAWSNPPGNETESSPSSSTATVREIGANSVSGFLYTLERALDTLPQPVAVFDAATRKMLLDNSAARRWNTGKSAGCSLGCSFVERFCTSLGDECPLERAMATKQPAVRQQSSTPLNSGPEHFECHAFPVLGEDGEVQYLVVFQVDVTNRVARQRELERANNVLRSNAAELEALYNQIRAGEGELREHERMLSTLLSNLPGMAYRCRNDANWSAEFVSEGCMELTGYDPEDFKTGGRASLYSLVHEEDRDRIRREVDESVAQDTPFQLEYRISTRQGAERWVWEKGLAITNERGDLVALEGFIADNTERRLAENQRAQLVTALEQAAESIVITDVEGTIRYVNPAFCRVSGYDASEAIGKNARFLRSGEHAPEFYRAMWETLSRGETWQGRIINRKKDGSLFEEEMSISPVRNEAGLLTSYVGVKRDVTREVEIEKRLRQSQKLEAIGTLAGGIAHDFNNILLPILGFTELLQSRFAVDDTAQSHLAAVVTACHRAKALIQQILTFSGRAEVERKPVCIDDVIAEAVHLLRASIPSTISIRRRSDSARGLAMAAPIELHQIVMNLGTNAYHAMKQTGGQLTVTTQTLVADERLSTRIPTLVLSRRYVMVQVEDTGTGIKPEILERVFDPFFTTKDKGQGTGLGLATVHGIVRDLGGEIAVESQVGRGTQITVYLPAYEGVKPDSESIAPIIVMGKGEQVLVVDDDDAILQYETMLLERLGYSVTAVNDPREALARWRAEPDRYDLLFTDQTMPDQTGTALAAELRSLGMRIPVVVTSGMNDQATAQLARSVNRCRFLPKPFTQAEASTVLRSLLDADERHAEENSK